MPTNAEIEQRIIERLESEHGLMYISTAVAIVSEAFAESEPKPWTPEVGDVIKTVSIEEQGFVFLLVTSLGCNSIFTITKDGISNRYARNFMCQPATPEEVAEFYTLTCSLPGVEGKRFRLYEDARVDETVSMVGNGIIRIVMEDGSSASLLPTYDDANALVTSAALAGLGLTRESHLIMPWKEGRTFDPPVAVSFPLHNQSVRVARSGTTQFIVREAFAESEPKRVEPVWTPEVGDVVNYHGLTCVVAEVAHKRGEYDKFIKLFQKGGSIITCGMAGIAPATPEEVAEFYTLTGKQGERVQYYRDENEDVVAIYANGEHEVLCVHPDATQKLLIRAYSMLSYFNLVDADGKPDPNHHLIMPKK